MSEYESIADAYLEEIRRGASDYLRAHPGRLRLFMHGAKDAFGEFHPRVLSVRPPNGMLLALEEILLPQTLQMAANKYIQEKAKGKTIPFHSEPIDPEYRMRRIISLLDDLLLLDAKFDHFAPDADDPNGVDQWLLIQFCLGRLEPILPEHLVRFVAAPMTDQAAACSSLPSERIAEIIPGCPFPGTVTAYCLDEAFMVHRQFYLDYTQSMGIWKQAESMLASSPQVM